jgi:hypothetical protein
MKARPDSQAEAAQVQRPALATRSIAVIAAIKLALHLAVLAVTPYGVHRDEFLYFSMGRHLQFWRMDFPPLIGVLGNLQRTLFGDTLAAARVLPAIEGTLVLILAALMARELGGRRFAQLLAMLSVLAAPLFLRSGNLFQPVVLDQLWWTLALFALARVINSDQHAKPEWWIVFGTVCGLGLLTKFSILFFATAALLALLATPMRRSLATPWPWLAAVTMLVMGSPSITGQIALGFPVLLQMHDLQATQLEHVTWATFALEQILLLGPVALIVALIGALSLVLSRSLQAFAVLGWTCIFAFAILLLLHGKSYYVGPVYPTLLAAGAVWLERLTVVRAPRMASWVRWTTAVAIVLLGVIALPIALPILSPARTGAYAARIGAAQALRTNRGEMDRLPQDFADMLGWGAQARALARAYRSLTPEEQREAVIAGDNYGEASAAEFYRAKYQLPPVVSAAGSWWFFGPGERAGRVLIVVGGSAADLSRAGYADVRVVERVLSPWSVPEERNVSIFIARDPRMTLQQLGPSLAGQN